MMTMMIMMTKISLRKMDLYRADFKLCLFSVFKVFLVFNFIQLTSDEKRKFVILPKACYFVGGNFCGR